MNLSAGDTARDLECAIDLSGAVEDVCALADAVAERARAKAAAVPHFVLEVGAGESLDAVDGDAGAHGGVLGGGRTGEPRGGQRGGGDRL